jgi:hypothetical protein
MPAPGTAYGLIPAYRNRYVFSLSGLGIGRFNSFAVSIHSSITISPFANACLYVFPSAAQPGNSGTSAMYARSSSLQYRIISYFHLLRMRTDLLILNKPLLRPTLVVGGPELGVHLEVLELPFPTLLHVLLRVASSAPHGLVAFGEGAGLKQIP